MKLAEALIQRADAQRRIEQLRGRIQRNASVQEGEEPAENPTDLLAEVETTLTELRTLIQQINRTNSATAFDDNRTLTDVLAERDVLMLERSVVSGLIDAAMPQFRYGRMEIKYESTVNIQEMQQRVDDISRRYRELDSAIQQLNWTVDLIEN